MNLLERLVYENAAFLHVVLAGWKKPAFYKTTFFPQHTPENPHKHWVFSLWQKTCILLNRTSQRQPLSYRICRCFAATSASFPFLPKPARAQLVAQFAPALLLTFQFSTAAVADFPFPTLLCHAD